MRTRLRRFAPYLVNTVATMVVGLATLPVLNVVAGPRLWSAIAVGQSIGAAAAVVIGLGWTAIGAARAAAMNGDERAVYLRESLRTRLIVTLPAVVGSAALVIAVVQETDRRTLALLGALTSLTAGLSFSWLFLAERSPLGVARYETVPRAFGTVAGLLIASATGSALWFVVPQLIGWVAAVVASALVLLRRYPAPPPGVRLPRGGASYTAALTTIIATVYVNAPVLLVSAFAPQSITQFAMIDKVQKYALTALAPLTQIAQGAVPSGGPGQLVPRIRRSLRLATRLGLGAGALFALFAWPTTFVLSAGRIEVPISMILGMSVALAGIVYTGITGLACLAAVGDTAGLLLSVVAGACVGVVIGVFATVLAGGEGTAWSVAAAELTVAVVQRLRLARALAGPA